MGSLHSAIEVPEKLEKFSVDGSLDKQSPNCAEYRLYN